MTEGKWAAGHRQDAPPDQPQTIVSKENGDIVGHFWDFEEALFVTKTVNLFPELVTVLDEVIAAKTEEIALHDQSNMGDPVWRQRHKAALTADLKKYQEMRAKCG